MLDIDAIVAGAGVWGATVARRLAEAGRKVLVLEKRAEPGGNVRTQIDGATGIEIHTYGSHIFHTNLPEVWHFVNRFVEFNGYRHQVLARYKGKTYFLPLGLALINGFFNENLSPQDVPSFMAVEEHRTAIFDAFFRGYTAKQWGMAPEEIDPSIIKRVPVRNSYDVNYFNDTLQGIPLGGYNSLFSALLSHPNITVRTSSPLVLASGAFHANGAELPAVPIYYSGAIDELFNFRFGPLPWRTLRFETERLPVRDWQGTSVVNYTEREIPYTRIHEFKHYHPERADIMSLPQTIIMREYPSSWHLGDEPYYPVNTPASAALLERYRACAAQIPHLVVGGRLGSYAYYDMDKAIAAALALPL